MIAMLSFGKDMEQMKFSYIFTVNAKLLNRKMKLSSKEKMVKLTSGFRRI